LTYHRDNLLCLKELVLPPFLERLRDKYSGKLTLRSFGYTMVLYGSKVGFLDSVVRQVPAGYPALVNQALLVLAAPQDLVENRGPMVHLERAAPVAQDCQGRVGPQDSVEPVGQGYLEHQDLVAPVAQQLPVERAGLQGLQDLVAPVVRGFLGPVAHLGSLVPVELDYPALLERQALVAPVELDYPALQDLAVPAELVYRALLDSVELQGLLRLVAHLVLPGYLAPQVLVEPVVGQDYLVHLDLAEPVERDCLERPVPADSVALPQPAALLVLAALLDSVELVAQDCPAPVEHQELVAQDSLEQVALLGSVELVEPPQPAAHPGLAVPQDSVVPLAPVAQGYPALLEPVELDYPALLEPVGHRDSAELLALLPR
jgi:hypothetical protein